MQCSFCASAALHGNRLRMRSAKNVVDEMEHLINDHDAGMIAFMDDTFTLKPNRVAEICDEIIKRELNIYWGCTARADTLSDELLRKLSESGCITPVSYTHLDVYKRQVYQCLSFIVHYSPSDNFIFPNIKIEWVFLPSIYLVSILNIIMSIN